MAITGVKISEFNTETGVMDNASNIFLACYKKSTDSNVNTQVCLNDIKNYIDKKFVGDYYVVKNDVYINENETIIGTKPPDRSYGAWTLKHPEVNTIINDESITLRNGYYASDKPDTPETATTYIKKGEFEIVTKYTDSAKNNSDKPKSIYLNTYVGEGKNPKIAITGADNKTGKKEMVEIFPYKITSSIDDKEYASLYLTNEKAFNDFQPQAMWGSIFGPIYGSPLHAIWNDCANKDGSDTPTEWGGAQRGGIYLGTKGSSYKDDHPNGRFLWVYDGSSWYFTPLQKCGTKSWN